MKEKKRQGCASLFIYKKKTNVKGGGGERGGIRLQIFRFFGGWVWSEGKKKGGTGGLCSTVTGTHSSYILKQTWCLFVCVFVPGLKK